MLRGFTRPASRPLYHTRNGIILPHGARDLFLDLNPRFRHKLSSTPLALYSFKHRLKIDTRSLACDEGEEIQLDPFLPSNLIHEELNPITKAQMVAQVP